LSNCNINVATDGTAPAATWTWAADGWANNDYLEPNYLATGSVTTLDACKAICGATSTPRWMSFNNAFCYCFDSNTLSTEYRDTNSYKTYELTPGLAMTNGVKTVVNQNDGTLLPDLCQMANVDHGGTYKCGLSYGATCDTNPGSMVASPTGTLFQKYCACRLSDVGSLTKMEYDYDAAKTATAVYNYKSWLHETLDPSFGCGITSCTLHQADCSAALAAPYDTLITQAALAPWAISISQTRTEGYAWQTVCQKCVNEAEVVSKTFEIRQKPDCASAISTPRGASALKDFSRPAGAHHDAIIYSATTAPRTLAPYTSASALFANEYAADCGDFTACALLNPGCDTAMPYTGSNLAITLTGGITAVQNIEMGYKETVCVRCVNLAGDETTHDNFVVEQLMDCSRALSLSGLATVALPTETYKPKHIEASYTLLEDGYPSFFEEDNY